MFHASFMDRKFQKLFKGVEKYLPIFENFLKISLTSDSPTRRDYIRPNWEQSSNKFDCNKQYLTKSATICQY